MATELVKPTSTATKPATKADKLRSLKNCMARILAPTRETLSPRSGGGLIQLSDFDLGAQLHHRVVRQVQKSAAPLALWCICANSFSRQCAMPLPMEGITVSRDRK